MSANTPFHGSDLEKIEQLYGIPKEKITGFGSNVNPLGLSPRLKEYLASRLDVLTSYPDPEYTGLRLGYAVTSGEALREEILSRKDPWTVSSLADLAGQFLFQDTVYIEETRSLISSERQRIRHALSGLAVKTYPCFANFILCRSLKRGVNASVLFEAAIQQGMMIRNCSDFPGLDENFFRFCFLLPEQNDRLLSCLAELLG
ncbi:MAG TPA: aminotransferase class I/II-fold pyridoxal phosphate-dependent enzyme [Candidatus Eisenbergiella intestinipullorum]|nr:aminotransferase class I/II-fold pyridoxal phosphate-dependent enzyme [Candidatus Eisenbergiella intestinipullorum]